MSDKMDMGERQQNDKIGRDRLIQIFEFLRQLTNHRNPSKRQIKEQIWVRWLDVLPDHPNIQLARLITGDGGVIVSEQPAALLRVKRPQLTSAPEPPEVLRSWLLPGWDDWKEEDVRCLESINTKDENGETIVVRFESDSERVEQLAAWQTRRSTWRVNEVPTRNAMQFFDNLHELYGEIQRQGEQVELMIGNGILTWQQSAGAINYPLIAQRVQLLFDPKIPEFTIVDADIAMELSMSLLQQLENIQSKVLVDLRELVSQSDSHPLSEELSGLLSQIPPMLAAGGQYVGDKRPANSPAVPEIGNAPVLFMRKRAQGIASAIDQLLAAISKGGPIPRALGNIAGIHSDEVDWQGDSNISDDGSGSRDTGNQNRRKQQRLHPSDTLFAKEANEQQRKIAQRLNQHGCVLVQGPPGTGKSHTIANLIGHLLAQGKGVLVTSDKTKPLKVLRDKLPPQLQPLCVSVLDSDAESKEQLERAVQGIEKRFDDDDIDILDSQAESLSKEREKLLDKISTLRQQMLVARQSEYREICFDGEAIVPIDAAKSLAANAATDSWIPGPVALGISMPLVPAEVVELYKTNAATNEDDDRFANATLLSVDGYPSPESVKQLLHEVNSQKTLVTSRRPNELARLFVSASDNEKLCGLIESLQEFINHLEKLNQWQMKAVDAGRRGENARAPWVHLVGKIQQLEKTVATAEISRVTMNAEIARGEPLPEQATRVREMISHVRKGGKLTSWSLIFHGEWKRLLLKWKVRGKTPTSLEHLYAVQLEIEVHLANDELVILWEGLMEKAGSPKISEFGDDILNNTLQYVGAINQAIFWWDQHWKPIEDQLMMWGLSMSSLVERVDPIQDEFGPMKRIIKAAREHLLPLLLNKAAELKTADSLRQLERLSRDLGSHSHPHVKRMSQHIIDRDSNAYRDTFLQLDQIRGRQNAAVRRRQLLSKLEQHDRRGKPVAGAWAAKIKKREAVHGFDSPPGDPSRAWKWRQLNDEIDRRAELDIEAIGKQITECEARLRELTIRLIDCLAWSNQKRRTGPRQRQALTGWLDTIRSIGGGFGKRVNELKNAARSKMKECQQAVPVWIMPLTRLAENFDLEKTRFDVVIIDEASQCDITALMAFAIAKQVVVVGDHEQVTPSAVGQDLTTIQNLITTHLDGIPNAHLYDGRLSIYDLARQSFGGQIRLVEHFRCVPEIIEFSNHLSYGGDVKPLRESSSSSLKVPVIEYRTESGSVTGKVNKSEAERVAALMVAAIEQPEYSGKSMGAICMVGDEQARQIEKLLRAHLTPQQIDDHQIICGNPPQLQGDERDVIFISMVDASDGKPFKLRSNTSFKQRFNVAASRARDQMWVVHSLDIADLASRDLRRNLIEHARNPRARLDELERLNKKTESDFERKVLKFLVDAGYAVHPQWEVGRYRIDLVVQGRSRRLAVECDGHRFHGIDELANDMARQADLERLGWTFFRIRGTDFYRDPQSVIQRLKARLEEVEITPREQGMVCDTTESDELIQRIRIRADELIFEWSNPTTTLPLTVDESANRDAGFKPRKSDSSAILFDWAMPDDGVEVFRQLDLDPGDDETETAITTISDDSAVLSETTLFDAGVEPIEDMDAAHWFHLAKWAEDRGVLDANDRHFAYTQGVRIRNGDSATRNQWSECLRILEEAKQLGYQASQTNDTQSPIAP